MEWVPASNKWKAVIFFKGRRYYPGCYEKFEDAVKARKRGEEEYHDKFLEEFAAANMEEQQMNALLNNLSAASGNMGE